MFTIWAQVNKKTLIETLGSLFAPWLTIQTKHPGLVFGVDGGWDLCLCVKIQTSQLPSDLIREWWQKSEPLLTPPTMLFI